MGEITVSEKHEQLLKAILEKGFMFNVPLTPFETIDDVIDGLLAIADGEGFIDLDWKPKEEKPTPFLCNSCDKGIHKYCQGYCECSKHIQMWE